jgi:hypothetical protein
MEARIQKFIEWASPGGTAGINDYHSENYDPHIPYFEWSPKVFAHGDQNTRSWLIKQEYAGEARSAFQRSRKGAAPKIFNPDALISSEAFLAFAKAYLNVISYYRSLRSPARATVYAMSYVEKALRDINAGDSSPTKINRIVLDRALTAVSNSLHNDGRKYDIGKELEMFAGMLQDGYKSKTFRFQDKGFRLISAPINFSSNIPNKQRKRAIALNSEDLTQAPSRLTSEHVAAVGLAYRKTIALFGADSLANFFSSIAGFSFTTVSMRMSDALVLSRDAVYRADGALERCRIRISRPKVGIHQDLPISVKLSDLADELFQRLLLHTDGASKALKFYIKKFGSDFCSINELYIPDHLKFYFDKTYLTIQEVCDILGISLPATDYSTFPSRFRNQIDVLDFVEIPGDISELEPPKKSQRLERMLTISAVETVCANLNIETRFPSDIKKNCYIGKNASLRYVKGGRAKGALLSDRFKEGQLAHKRIKSDDLKSWLLKQFQSSSSFPHWPFIDKDETMRVDNALLVWFELENHKIGVGENKGRWWMPGPVKADSINRWLSGDASSDGEPLLFRKTDIRLRDGTYPSLTLHDTRKYHHTEALLAGAHEVFIDELAGRKSGTQSDHYDLRSPHEILVQSIDTFDPDVDFNVIGPVADQAQKVKLVDRQAFLYENAAPKHVTDIGGCSTDWSLDPCKQYGDCTRCDQQIWRKGDKKRLPEVQLRRNYTIEMINKAESKIKLHEDPPRPLLLHYQQFKDDLARYDAILAAEDNDDIEIGTLVTFAAPSRAMSSSDLTLRLRTENMLATKEREYIDYGYEKNF